VQVQPAFGLFLGISAARGAWLAREIESSVAPGQDSSTQRAFGLDAEYSVGHWIVRGEAIRSAWKLPGAFSAATGLDISTTTGWIESSYRLTPRLFVAGRLDAMTFSTIRGTLFDGQPIPWDAPVSRAEIGGGWYLQRNLVAKVSLQQNWRDAGRQRQRTFVSGQLLFWF
jgi:hypothetical protein